MTLQTSHAQVLAYERSPTIGGHTQRLACVFNFSAQTATWPMPTGWVQASAHNLGLASATVQDQHLVLQPWGGWVASL
jgi:hypothetical protein